MTPPRKPPPDGPDGPDPATEPAAPDPAEVTVRPGKKALKAEREARLAQALRDNLARRKGQLRARVRPGPDPEPE